MVLGWDHVLSQLPRIQCPSVRADKSNPDRLHIRPVAFAESQDLAPKDAEGNIQFDSTPFTETYAVSSWCGHANIDAYKYFLKAMEKLVGDKVRAIGVSNFNVKKLEELIKSAKIVPAVNQVTCSLPVAYKCKGADISSPMA